MTVDFFIGNHGGQKKVPAIFQLLKERKCEARILYTEKKI